MKKRKKIYYVPGMITLILLPILCIWFLKKNYYEERCIQIAVPSRYNPNLPKDIIRFDTTLLSLPENRRIYTTFKFDGNIKINNIKLDSISDLLKQIVQTDDTIKGIHIILNDSVKYGTFIEILDLFFSMEFPFFVPYDSEIWFLHKKRIISNSSMEDAINRL